MSITLDGIVFDEADFAGGGYLDLVSVGGVPYPRWQAFLLAALRDAAKILVASSTTSVAIGAGSKAFVLADDIPLQPGANVKIVDIAAPNTNWMFGEVTAYVSATKTLTVNVAKTAGGGTLANWRVQVAGLQGEAGAPGSAPYGATLPSALGTAATGSNADAARIDHVHPAADLGTGQVTGTLPLAKGGTGATTAAGARSSLGISATGDAVATAANATAARAALGGTTVGGNVFTAADEAAALSALGASPALPPMVNGRYYTMPGTIQGTSTVNITANRLYAMPMYIPSAVTVTRIGVKVETGATGGARLGIYRGNVALTVAPLVLDAGTVDTSTTGDKEIVISQLLEAGWYWLVMVGDGAPGIAFHSDNVGGVKPVNSNGFSASSLGSDNNANFRSFTFGMLPDPFGSLGGVSRAPALWLRIV
jgi:hypothetical protein